MNERKEAGLDKLGFRDWCRHAKQRFAGKEDGAFWQGPNLTGEMELREIVEKLGADMIEHRQRPQIRDFVSREANVFQKIERLLQARSDKIIAIARELTDEKFESRKGVEAVLNIARRHR